MKSTWDESDNFLRVHEPVLAWLRRITRFGQHFHVIQKLLLTPHEILNLTCGHLHQEQWSEFLQYDSFLSECDLKLFREFQLPRQVHLIILGVDLRYPFHQPKLLSLYPSRSLTISAHELSEWLVPLLETELKPPAELESFQMY